MTSEKRGTRRRYGAALKAQVVAQCNEPGASVAKVAMSHGINANVVHRWRQLARDPKAPSPAKTGEFMVLPLAVPPAVPATPADIRVELRRGSTTMTITWPASAAAEFAVWTRELLR
jgi:transposase